MRLVVLIGELLQERARQQRDVLGAVAQRRQRQADDRQAAEQVLGDADFHREWVAEELGM